MKFFITVILIVLAGTALAQPFEEWVARYDGPGNVGDGANALAVDSEGNVYVTGNSFDSTTSADYTTIKYDASGEQLWLARFDGANDVDVATDLAVDMSGNVYVTGWTTGSGGLRSYTTIKYDCAGNELWVASYDYGCAAALEIDLEGNIYVTGDANSDFTTIMYDPDGNEQWVAVYNGPANGTDKACDLALDGEGYVYVTGKSKGVGTYYDIATVKYNAGGNQVWAARYNGPWNDEDIAAGLAVDAQGNVYVSGSTFYPDGCDFNYCTIKYDCSGNLLWDKHYGRELLFEVACDLALDERGYVYVTGYSEELHDMGDYLTIKYSPGGEQIWVARYDGPDDDEDVATDLAVDDEGNVYVTGCSSYTSTFLDYATIKYDSDGNLLWVGRYDGPANHRDEASALAVDTYGNVYVTGNSRGQGTGSDFATIKYAQSPFLEMTCEALTPLLCRGKNFYFKHAVNNKTTHNISLTLFFRAYAAYECDFQNILVTIPREKTYDPGVTESHYFFKVPSLVPPGQYSASISGTLSGFDLFCCMNTDIVECGPWRIGDNRQWDLVEDDRPEIQLPTVTELHQNYPNPFNATTEIIYTLAEAGHVRLTIYNLCGELIESLLDSYQGAGEYQVVWDASEHASGIYFYRLTAGDFTETRRTTLLK